MYHAVDGEGGGDDDVALEGGDQVAAGTAAAAVDAEEKAREEEGLSFWMTFDDFTTEFSQARIYIYIYTLLYPTSGMVQVSIT